MYYSTYAAPARSTSTRAWLVSGLLFPVGAFYLLNPGALVLLDTASMLMYELGRMLFGLLGGTVVHAGGTIGQLLLPIVLVSYFVRQRYAFGVQVFLFWLGQNLVNVSYNVAKPGYLYANAYGHADWQALLTALNLSDSGLYVGAIIFAAGSICFMTSLILPGFMRD